MYRIVSSRPGAPGTPFQKALCRSGLLLLCLLLACAFARAEEEDVYIENAWNYVDGSMDTSAGIPEDALGRLGRIRDAGRLVVVTEPYFAPQEFIDDTKTGQERYVGADMELARLIAARMGVELQIVPLAFSDVLTGVAEGKYDLAISALSFTPARAAQMEMSKGYYFTGEALPSGLVIRAADAEQIAAVDDLTGRDIAAQSGSVQESMAVDNIFHYRQFRRLASVEDVYRAVKDGTVDAGIVDIDNARVYISRHPESGLQIVAGVAFSLPEEYAGDRVAAPKGEIQLLYFVNGVIDEVVASGQYDKWYEEFALASTGASGGE